MSHPKLKFKVDATARENGLGGCAILTKENNLVLVEGGKKSAGKLAVNIFFSRAKINSKIQKSHVDQSQME